MSKIPVDIRIAHNEICKNCDMRIMIARKFDMHFDWIDCPYDCENDYEHYLKSTYREGEKINVYN